MKQINFRSASRLTRVLYLFLLLVLSVLGGFAQNVGINATGAVPNANAGLDVDFSNKGVLIPRVALVNATSASPLSGHVAGMIVYNTATAGDVTPGFYYNTGSRWVPGFPAGTTTGDMLYWNGAAWVRIPAGMQGQFLQFSTSGIPTWTGAAFATLTTNSVTAITAAAATTGGNITSDGGSSILTRGVCYATTPNPTISNSILTASNPIGTGAFTSNLTGLLRATTYYVRAYATNNSMTTYGNQQVFTTLALPPTVSSTTAASSITSTTAVSGGNVSNDGGSTITERGVCYALTSNPTVVNSKIIDGSPGTGTFISNLSLLTPNTRYYVRAYASNVINSVVNTSYAPQISFYTAPTVSTASVSNIGPISATCGGTVTSAGTVFARGVCWSTSPGPTVLLPTKTNDGTTSGVFTSTVTGLSPNTQYYIRAYAISTDGATSSYGTESSFTTSAPTPPVITSTTAITAITSSSALSGGAITNDGGSAITHKGVCWSTSTNPVLGAGNFTDNGTGTGAFGSSITGLQGITLYYVRAYATNIAGTGYGPVTLSFTTCVTPGYALGDLAGGGKVFYINCDGSLLVAALVDQSTSVAWGCSGTAMNTPATLGTGSANTTTILAGCITRPIAASVARDYAGGGYSDWYLPSREELREMMYYTPLFLTGTYWSSTDANSASNASIYYNFGSNPQLTSAPKTSLYKVRAIRKIAAPTLPVVTTDAVTNIGANSVTSGGNVTSDGGAATTRGVCWSTSPGPTIADSKTTDGTGTGIFISNLTGLTSFTQYHLRAYATNFVGTTYGTELIFTTIGITAPVVGTTTAATGITSGGASTGGTIINDGGDPITAKGVCWSTSSNPTLGIGNFTTDGTGTDAFTSLITGLTSNTTYYVRAYATNGINTSYGASDVSFTTLGIAPYTVGQILNYGTVAYVAPDGTGFIVSGDIAPNPPETSFDWGCSGTHVAVGTAIGTGKANTDLIIASCGANTAAGAAKNYNGGGFNDWYLPSSGEWGMIAILSNQTSNGVVNFFTSSEYSTNYAMAATYFGNFGTPYASGTNRTGGQYTTTIRAIRDFAAATLPAVTTDAISNIGAGNATGGGNVTNDGGAPILDAGVCWSTTSNPTIADFITQDTWMTGPFVSNISGLALNTTYYVRAYVTNAAGTTYGTEEIFTTLATATVPIITTLATSNPTASSVTSGGTIVSDGGDPVTVSGICWNTAGTPTTGDFLTTDGLSLGLFYSDATGLTEGTIYFIRAYATNGVNTAYGNEISYTPGAPIITTNPITALVGALAEGGGNLDYDGGHQVTEWGLCWSMGANPTIASDTVRASSYYLFPGASNFYANMTGLVIGTTYHVRAFATNSKGTSYGADISFDATAAYIGQVLTGGNVYGNVFDIDGTGAHGMIAMPSSYGVAADWGCPSTLVGTSTAIGTGNANTVAINSDVFNTPCTSSLGGDFPAGYAANGFGPGWYLPSKDEMGILWTNRTAAQIDFISPTGSNTFWSSSEDIDINAWYLDGSTGDPVSALKTELHDFFVIRSF